MSIRLTFFFAALILLAVVHVVALELYLYWKFPWFDIPMHLLGGISVALGYSILHTRLSPRLRTFSWYIAAVLLVGIGWEIFEYAAGISLAREESFLLDTALDLCMDTLGGILGYGIAQGAAPIAE
jgi:uncharacterized BrkB/YihY/UPF0761 family membrane protein